MQAELYIIRNQKSVARREISATRQRLLGAPPPRPINVTVGLRDLLGLISETDSRGRCPMSYGAHETKRQTR